MSTGWSSLRWLHSLTQPTLVLTGDADPIMPVFNARVLARLIPNARLHVLPGAGHLFLVDEPESAVPWIQEFLTEPMTAVPCSARNCDAA